MNNAVFGKTMENVREDRDFKIITSERRRNYLVSKPSFHTKNFHRKFISNRKKKKKNEIPMNKPVYLGMPILELSKILMYEFLYDYVHKSMAKKQSCVI